MSPIFHEDIRMPQSAGNLTHQSPVRTIPTYSVLKPLHRIQNINDMSGLRGLWTLYPHTVRLHHKRDTGWMVHSFFKTAFPHFRIAEPFPVDFEREAEVCRTVCDCQIICVKIVSGFRWFYFVQLIDEIKLGQLNTFFLDTAWFLGGALLIEKVFWVNLLDLISSSGCMK